MWKNKKYEKISLCRVFVFASIESLAFDNDSDNERLSTSIILWWVQRTAVVTGVRRLHDFDHQNSTNVDSKTARRCVIHVVRGLDDASAPRPDDQPMWGVVHGRTMNTSGQAAGEVGASKRPQGDRPDRRGGVCPLRQRRPGRHRRRTIQHRRNERCQYPK